MTIHTTYTKARAGLASLMRKVLDDKETVIITRRNGERVALIDADELDSLAETAYLLRSPANARRLFEAIEEADQGKGAIMTAEELRRKVGLGDEEA